MTDLDLEDSSPSCPPFRIGESRYDQSSFLGRLLHILDVVDPRTLLVSQSKLDDAVALLKQFQDQGSNPVGVSDEQLWRAQKIKQAILHPDTGEKIFHPFRMAGFVPFGAPLIFGILIPNQTAAQMVFWQWINQSHNACVNYSNRNASKPTPTSRFLTGYVGAISSACGIAVGLSALLKRSTTFSPATRMLVQRFVPFPAVASASVCNCLLMRFSEIKEGIDVRDKEGNLVGSSQAAAKKALKETAITRALLPIPCVALPPLVMTVLERSRFIASRPKIHLPLLGVITVLSFGLGLPVAIALFPQYSEIKRKALEPEVQERMRAGDDVLIYNKGL